MIVLSRIDDRLIHGQVVEGWVNFLKATCIFVADDQVASNAFQRSIMELSVPQGLRVAIGRVEDICGQLRTAALNADRIILLFSNPADVLRAIRSGLDCRVINIGGMHYVPGKRKLMDVLAVDDKDLAALKEIAANGIQVNVQTVPTQRPVALEKVFTVCKV
jgi:mannose/fructose/N-acetylgalactosamine-specific phosphotransferase system component IIB